jgi:hypothetical protein
MENKRALDGDQDSRIGLYLGLYLSESHLAMHLAFSEQLLYIHFCVRKGNAKKEILLGVMKTEKRKLFLLN